MTSQESYEIAKKAEFNKKLAYPKVQKALELIKNNVNDGLFKFTIQIEDDETISILKSLGYYLGEIYKGNFAENYVDVKVVPFLKDYISSGLASGFTFQENVKSIIDAVIYSGYGQGFNQNPNIAIATIISGVLFRNYKLNIDEICNLAKIIESNIDYEALDGGINYENITDYINLNIRNNEIIKKRLYSNND